MSLWKIRLTEGNLPDRVSGKSQKRAKQDLLFWVSDPVQLTACMVTCHSSCAADQITFFWLLCHSAVNNHEIKTNDFFSYMWQVWSWNTINWSTTNFVYFYSSDSISLRNSLKIQISNKKRSDYNEQWEERSGYTVLMLSLLLDHCWV